MLQPWAKFAALLLTDGRQLDQLWSSEDAGQGLRNRQRNPGQYRTRQDKTTRDKLPQANQVAAGQVSSGQVKSYMS